ncbi:MAG: DUF1016 family protein [Nitrospiraceae bacterium]|nr:MAG: DUF1016 family protein [Nitrospiraceae bacterium]
MSKKNQISKNNSSNSQLGDIRKMIEDSRSSVAVSVNAVLTVLYWRIGKRFNKESLKGEHADYRTEFLATLSQIKDYTHSHKYYRLLAKFMPDWERRKERLERAVV